MRRTDRLFELVQLLRDGRLHRGEALAERLGVSLRTLYRDMDTLVKSGVPVAGERGVGYMMTAPITLPPLNLTLAELEALHLGVAVICEAADDELRSAARTLAAKVDAVLPENTTAPEGGWGFAVYPFADAAAGFRHMPLLRQAIRERRKLAIRYRALSDAVSERVIHPLQLEYWGRIWTTTAWCALRGDFRCFRVDRIEAISDTGEPFQDTAGQTLADYFARQPGS